MGIIMLGLENIVEFPNKNNIMMKFVNYYLHKCHIK